MMTHKRFDSYAGIHFADINKSHPNGYGNDMLRTELGNLGVGTLVIPNAQAYDFKSGTVRAHPTEGGTEMTLASLQDFNIGAGQLEVVRARVFTPKSLEAQIDVVNGPKLRELGSSKWAQYELAGEFMPKTVRIEADQPIIDESVSLLSGDTLVVKADVSQQSKYISLSTRSEVANAVYGMRYQFEEELAAGKKRKNNDILVQEFMPGAPWTQLRPLDKSNHELLTRPAANTELRMYCYVDANDAITQNMRFHATLGVVDGDNGGWVAYVDQDSIPEEAFAISQTVSQRMLQAAGVRGGYFSIDLVQGPERPDGTGSIYIREINTRDPMMVEPHRNVGEAQQQRKMLANMMATIAKRG
jgi:hypothetical protein